MSRRKQAKPQHINSEEDQGEQPPQQPTPDLADAAPAAPAAGEPGEWAAAPAGRARAAGADGARGRGAAPRPACRFYTSSSPSVLWSGPALPSVPLAPEGCSRLARGPFLNWFHSLPSVPSRTWGPPPSRPPAGGLGGGEEGAPGTPRTPEEGDLLRAPPRRAGEGARLAHPGGERARAQGGRRVALVTPILPVLGLASPRPRRLPGCALTFRGLTSSHL